MTTQQTIIACTAAIVAMLGFVAYANSETAFWKPQTQLEKWCAENDMEWRGERNRVNCEYERLKRRYGR